MNDSIQILDDVLFHIIEVYTYEAGCRKLKQLLNDIIGQICYIMLLGNNTVNQIVTIDDIDNKYLKDCHLNITRSIHGVPTKGKINCLYANDLGKGGILPSTGKFFPSKSFLELKVTGLIDEMMKESIEVAKTLAWNITNDTQKQYFINNPCGIHIHCGEGSGSISKSGTSAGIAITLLIYSLLNDLEIPNDVAVTGEASLDGSVSEIGALEHKIEGGIKSGVKTFIFPKQNYRDFEKFLEKTTSTTKTNINFYPVSSINEIISILFSNTT
jgi:ATP-dependent Lon protease